MKKIAILTNFIPTYRQGFYDRLFKERDNITVYCQREGASRNITVINERYGDKVKEVGFWNMKGDRFVWHYLPFLEILRNYDIIVSDGNPRHLSQAILVTIARLCGKEIAIWSSYSSRRSATLGSKLRLGWWRIFKYFMTYTERDLKQLAGAGWQSSNMVSLNNGLDQSKIEIEKEKWTATALSEWQKEKGIFNKRVILSSGRVIPKRYDMFLETLPKLKELFPDIMWLLIGDGKGLQRLQDRAVELGVSDVCKFEGAIYDEANLAPRFLSADLFIYSEGIGLGLMHSFGYGIPVVIHDVMYEHGPEIFIFKNGETGMLYKKDDLQDLLKKLETLLNDRVKLKEMGQAGLEVVQNKHNTGMMVKNFKRLIQVIESK